MKLKGIMEFPLDGFLTFRGYAKLGEIARISKPDKSYQREAIDSHLQDINNFLKNGENLFFPEVILGCYLPKNDEELERLETFYDAFHNNQKGNFGFKQLNIGIQQPKPYGDITFKVATLSTLKAEGGEGVFYRIDGNHRISAAENGSDKVKDMITPFSIIFFRTEEEYERQSKMVFHNTNFKHIPLSMEHNLKLIFGDDENFNDNFLENDPSFGLHYCRAKYIKYDDIDKYFPNISKSLQTNPRETFFNLFKLLCSKQECKNMDKEKVEKSLSRINEFYKDDKLKESENGVIVSAFIYYHLSNEEKFKDKKIELFKKWILKNHIYKAKNLKLESLIDIFDEIYNSRIKNIFVAMPFSNNFDDVWYSIVEVYDDLITEGYQLDKTLNKYKDKYRPNRIDKSNEESKDLIEKIKEGIEECDLMIADLTDARPNIYYEVGLAEAQGKKYILICEKSKDNKETKVHFDLMNMERIEYDRNNLMQLKNVLKEKLASILESKIVDLV